MLKKNNRPIEDVLKIVAKENGFKYIPPGKRTPKEILIEKSASGETLVSLVDVSTQRKRKRKNITGKTKYRPKSNRKDIKFGIPIFKKNRDQTSKSSKK